MVSRFLQDPNNTAPTNSLTSIYWLNDGGTVGTGFIKVQGVDWTASYDWDMGNPKSFEKAMETVDMLARLQKEDSRLRIHSNTVAMSENMDEIWELTEYLRKRCPSMEHHNLAVIRGDRKNPSLQGPALEQYKQLYAHVAEVWKDRDEKRFGSVVEPMLQWAKVKTI